MSNMYKQIFVREVRVAFSAVILKIFPKSSFLFFPSVLQRRNAAAKREKKDCTAFVPYSLCINF